jgi:hypothetical protein
MIQKVSAFLIRNKVTFLLLSALVLADRILLLINFHFRYTGSDDLIFWQAATDYMHGIFHEPYFYGQDYNFMLEAVFAIPLLAMGIPHHIALPLSSAFISLFPFFFIAWVLYKRNYFKESFVFIVIPLLLPVEYGMLASVTRGFVSGLFFSSFLIFPLLEPTKKSSFLIAALSLSLGYIFNPNSLTFALAVAVYLFLCNYKRFSFYWINAIVGIPILLVEFFAKRFYVLHPDHKVNGMWDLHFSFSQLFENFKGLDKFYGMYTPLLWSAGWAILVFIFIAGIFIWKKDWRKGVALISCILFIIAMPGINKVNDRLDTLFFSSERMFLGIPLLTGLAFFWGREFFTAAEKIKYAIVGIAVVTFCIKCSMLLPAIDHNTSRTNLGPVAIKKINEVKCDCEKIAKTAAAHHIGLVVFAPEFDYNVSEMAFYNYGCRFFEKDFPKTVVTIYEKRTWEFNSAKTNIEKNVMIFGSEIALDSIRAAGNPEVLDTANPKIFIYKNNQLRTDSLLKRLKIEFRRTTY